jgi:FlaA1/EpsC-like NDP-sugar epimerase
MLKKWIFWRSIQICLDFILIYSAFILAYILRVGFINSSDFSLPIFAIISLISTLMWSGFLALTKYYRLPIRSGKRAFYDIILIFIGGIISNGFMIVLYFFPRDILFSRFISIYIFVIGVSFLLISQLLFRKILAWQKKRKKNIYRTLIIGVNRTAEIIINAIKIDPYAPHKVIGVIDPYGLEKKITGSKILGKLNKLEDLCKEESISEIIQCDGFEHTLNIISFCEEHDIKFQFDPALRGIYEKNLRIREVAGQTMISFVKRDFQDKNKEFFYKWGDKFLRQIFDID